MLLIYTFANAAATVIITVDSATVALNEAGTKVKTSGVTGHSSWNHGRESGW